MRMVTMLDMNDRVLGRSPLVHRSGALRQAGLVLLAVAVLLTVASGAAKAEGAWRIRVKTAACVQGPRVLLGEIAEPAGSVDPLRWKELAATELWAAPPREGRPMMINRRKLSGALQKYLGAEAARCLIPTALAIQKGGAVLSEIELRRLTVNTLTPLARSLEGEAELRDFQLPSQMFLRDRSHRVLVETAAGLRPGRVGLRLKEVDHMGSTVRRVTASVFLDLWKTVPAAVHPLNRGEAVTPDKVTWIRQNAAYLRGNVWDGKSGPMRIKVPVGGRQVIYQANIEPMPLVRKGDVITLLYSSATLRLAVPAEALEDGGIGQLIQVRNMSSRREIHARVQDSNTVTIGPAGTAMLSPARN